MIENIKKIDNILERDIPDCSAPGWVYRTRNAVDLMTGENRFIFGTCEVEILEKKI